MRVGVLMVMVVLLLAGCSSPPETVQGDPVLLDDDGESVTVKAGHGVLRGTAIDDAGLPLRGVHVAVLDTPDFTSTDASGSFRFVDLPAGTYMLRADLRDHVSAQQEVKITSGGFTDVELVLPPRVQAGAGYTQHVHDRWGGQESLVVVDQSFEWPADPRDTLTSYHCLFADGSGVWGPANIPVRFDEGHQIIPFGTERVEVVLEWEAGEAGYETFAFAWRTAASQDHFITDWVESGQTITLQLSQEMWDSSHQTFSLWSFWVCRDKNTPGSAERQIPPGGSVQVTMTLHRMQGDIPPEPGHPHFWNGSTTLPVVTAAEKRFSFLGGVGGIPQATAERTGSDNRFRVLPDEGALVAPGTSELQAHLTWTYDAPVDDPMLTPPWSLSYKPAGTQDWQIESPAELGQAEKTGGDAGSATFRISLDDAPADAFYQQVSNWYFYLNLEGEEDETTWTNPCLCDITLTLDITAHKRPGFEEG